MSLPPLSDLFTKTPLYEKYKLDNDDLIEVVYQLRSFEDSIDSYCPECGKESTFLHIVDDTIKHRYGYGKMWKLTGNQNATELKDYRFDELFL